MIEANWFLVINKSGNFVIGRTNAPCQVKRSAFMPDGSPGRMIVAPPHFVRSFRTQLLLRKELTPAMLLDKQQNLQVYKRAILAWEDQFKVSLLK